MESKRKDVKNVMFVDLEYPRNQDIQCIEINLVDVRAADGIRIQYDFERDGWSISQAQVFSWDAGDTICDPKWKEVAFIDGWASKTDDD